MKGSILNKSSNSLFNITTGVPFLSLSRSNRRNFRCVGCIRNFLIIHTFDSLFRIMLKQKVIKESILSTR